MHDPPEFVQEQAGGRGPRRPQRFADVSAGQCAVPPGLASYLIHTRHFRAGLQAVPSLRDSPSYPYPYPALPCRATGCAVPPGLASYPYPYPALPCRAAGCAVPSGLASYPYPYPALPCRVQAVTSLRDSPHTLILTRHFHAGLQAVPSLRDSPHTLSLPGTSVPGYGCAVPSGLLCCGSNSSLAMRTSPQACRAIRRGLAGLCLNCAARGRVDSL
jgi:hypothetical protein